MDLDIIISDVYVPGISAGGGEISGDEIRDKLMALEGDSKLDASAVKGLPIPVTVETFKAYLEALEGDNKLSALVLKDLPTAPSGADLAAVLSALEGEAKLSFASLKDRTKSNITGADKALNKRGKGNVLLSAYQTASMTNIMPGDYWVVAGVAAGQIVEDGDWVIAELADAPFTFEDTSRWMILKLSRLSAIAAALWESGVGAGSVKTKGANNLTPGAYALATGQQNMAEGDHSAAFGNYAHAVNNAEQAYSSGRFATAGDSQFRRAMLRLETASNVAALMELPGEYRFDEQKTHALTIDVVCRTSADGSRAADQTLPSRHWRFNVLVSMNGPNEEIVVSGGVVNTTGGCTASCQVITTNTYYGRLAIACQGMADRTTRWHAVVENNEVKLTYEEAK